MSGSGVLVKDTGHDYHIHDHEDILGRPNFRHDHPPARYPDGHRHLSKQSKMLLPPTVAGCLKVEHDEVDCYVASAKGDITFSERCQPCKDAWRA